MTPFLLDGVAYDVLVTSLKRSFSVLDTDKSGRTQDGEMYRDIIGTFYNYEMTVRANAGNTAALDAFWEAISQPVASHVCTFPYNQATITQRMYVTGGDQQLRLLQKDKTYWNELAIKFIAMAPRVTP